jgi:RNA polymerase sigma-70 factor (ECF subfamily)
MVLLTPAPPTHAVADLAARARGGDGDAFAHLYDRFARPLFAYLAGLLRRREEAEDALQSAFLGAWTHLPSLRDEGRFVPWLFRIARNAATDVARRRARWPQPLAEDDDLVGPTAEAAHDDSLRRLVADLKPKTRALVLLRAVEGWSVEDTAVALRTSVASVRRRYARALAHLRERLATSEGRTP